MKITLQGEPPDWHPERMPPLPYGARESEAGQDNHPILCTIDASTQGAPAADCQLVCRGLVRIAECGTQAHLYWSLSV